MKTAQKFVELAYKWKGYNEANGSHKEIIDVYNSFTPRARGYKVKYTDAWCASFVSAVSIKGGFTDIIPPECGCGEMIKLFQALGCWIENENRVPNIGDIVFYDWQDNGVGDNTGWSDHVGIVSYVSRETFTVIEGNNGDCVKEVVLKINAKNLRGFAVPKYDKEVSKPSETVSKPSEGVAKGVKTVNIELNVLRNGSEGEQVVTLQTLLKTKGYDIGRYGIDGDFGNDTEEAVEKYQDDHGLEVDGVVGFNTWTSLLKG